MHKNGYLYYTSNILSIFTTQNFQGWGRKKTGNFALWCHDKFAGELTLFEDGFIRSVGLGVEGSPSFSVVEDNMGIYYDATQASKLENILNTYDFASDETVMQTAYEAIKCIKEHDISKYNHAPMVDDRFCTKYGITGKGTELNILIVAQTADDASLKYGLAEKFTTKEIIEDAIDENPNASMYIKIHPDVLSGKKESDIALDEIPQNCIIIDEDVNPVSLLKYMDKVYTKTSGMGMEALILAKEVVCYGLPYYAGWGLTTDKQSSNRRTRKIGMEELFAGAYILYTGYYNPYSQKKSDILDTIKSIIKYRDIYRKNEGDLYFFGFTWWKQRFVRSYFPTFKKHHIIFCSTLKDAMKKGLNEDKKIFIWGKRGFNKNDFSEVETYAKEKNIVLSRVEDGFIRSVSLGSDLTKAYSLVADSRGIYFDPAQESDLEYLLNTYTFDEELIKRARSLQLYLIKNKISKYNMDQNKKLELTGVKKGQTVVMVPGQVEDDASIIYGAKGMTNLELLQEVRENVPDAYIIYKPHPDVLAGNRRGKVDESIVLKYCNTTISNASLDSVLELADEVHTMTSLVGFEALVRGKKVTTYGLPFYAGWGLTADLKSTSGRDRKPTLEELIAATLILYPRYIHPKTNVLCEVEVLLAEIDKEKKRYSHHTLYRMYIDSRNFISRQIQFFIKVVFGK